MGTQTHRANSRCLSSKCMLGDRRCFQRRRTKICQRSQRLDVQAVIPMLAGDATDQTPPDLPSYLFKERIVYMGMSLVPSVTELMMAELLYLQYDNPTKPINMYINSTGVTKGGPRYGHEMEAFAIYDVMMYVKPPIRTMCVGSAFGEAAMLLSAGAAGMRAALPSSTIMLRQPIQRFEQMQASDIDIYRNELRKVNTEIVTLLSKHTGRSEEKIKKDINRPKYFSPYDAVDYGIVDKVLEAEEHEVTQALSSISRGTYEWKLSDPDEDEMDDEAGGKNDGNGQ
eukprot:TRINITY_DN4174_c0_g3_i1.p1 TRINITY_DN4174_c0_g3~~TRINITY_DN4174_c0_g3_i1.p1  ORF type:complete len:284 (-),score=33.78 TRINITY_DN4174_c0_g3_i1:341-1192(-)